LLPGADGGWTPLLTTAAVERPALLTTVVR